MEERKTEKKRKGRRNERGKEGEQGREGAFGLSPKNLDVWLHPPLRLNLCANVTLVESLVD